MDNPIISIDQVITVLTNGKFSRKDHLKVEEITRNKAESAFKLKMYTNDYEYSISLVLRSDIMNSYLGCIMRCRKPRPGEDHCRGNDLADGRATFETLNNIIIDILSCELKKIEKPVEYQIDEG